MMIPFHIIGLLYAIFFLKEVKKDESKDEAAYDNPALEVTELPSRIGNIEIDEPEKLKKTSKNACLEFFDPRLAIQCVKSLLKKRDYGVRSIIILLMLMHFVTNGITVGETQNIFYYQRVVLGWDIATNTYHNVFSIVLGLTGTVIMVGLLSKYWKIQDIVLTLISTAFTLASRVVYSVVKSTVGFFIGTAVDFTFSVKFLGVRSIISKIVPTEDLSTMFALMGLCEAFASLVFSYIYPTFYQYLLSNKNTRDVSEMFHLSLTLITIALITYS